MRNSENLYDYSQNLNPGGYSGFQQVTGMIDSEIRHGIFGVLLEALGIWEGGLIFGPIRSSLSLESRSTPPRPPPGNLGGYI